MIASVGPELPWGIATTLVIGLLVANAFFVAVEFALVAARRPNVRALAREGNSAARLADEAMGDLNTQLAGSQLGITVMSLGLGFTAEPALARAVHPLLDALGLPEGLADTVGIILALALVSAVHMVFGEMVPKNVAIATPERTVVVLIRPFRWFMVVARPLIALTNGLARGVLWLIRVTPRDELSEVHTADEIAQMVAMSKDEGIIEDFAHSLLAGALDLASRPVAAVMIPASQVATVHRTDSVAAIERAIIEHGHSRLPVIGDSLDDVDGFVHAKDLLAVSGVDREQPPDPSLIHRMLLVDPNEPLEDVLRKMRRARRHLALVRDPTPQTRGLVTLEDVLEALVGDIADESDRPAHARRRSRLRVGRGDRT